LKCKLCTAFVPYYEIAPHYSYETLTTSVVRYFDLIDTVEKFTINGGEALLHEKLPEIIDFLAGYIDRIGMLEILTNGTIIPNEQLLKSLSFSPKVNILVNNYGPSLSNKIPQITNLFRNNGIAFRLREQNAETRYCGGWVDISDLSYKNRSEEETENLFNHCVYPGAFRCFAIFGDKAYICGVYIWCKTEGIISSNPYEYVDFSEDSTASAEEIKKQILGFYDRRFFTSCKYCNGFCEDSERFLPAEQM
jgi:hypothetical protein